MKYIFVEGYDDEVIVEILMREYNISTYRIIQYAQAKNKKITGIIETCKTIGDEYILLADLDGKTYDIRINEIIKCFKNIDIKKVFFSIQEIEAWYLAGVSKKIINKYKINRRILLDTKTITKEKFAQVFGNNREDIFTIKLNILNEFDFINAKTRNQSYNEFLVNALGLF